MDIVKPNADLFLLPAGAREVTIAPPPANSLPGCEALPAIVTPDGKVASSWRPTAGELAMLNAGVAVTLVVWTSGRPLQPVCLMVGAADLR